MTSSFNKYAALCVGSGSVVVYRAVQWIQIFCAQERTNEQTDRGVSRGPRGPKKTLSNIKT